MNIFELLFGKRKAKRIFPYWSKIECSNALHAAKNGIKSKGVHKIKDLNLKVEFVAGTRKYGTQWAWYQSEPSWPNGGLWVYGTCSGDGKLIRVAIDPNNGLNVNFINKNTLLHEMGHHWLSSTGKNIWHDPIYDEIFPNWKGARETVGKTIDGESDQYVSYYANKTHYDGII